jgi:hypothetical protein
VGLSNVAQCLLNANNVSVYGENIFVFARRCSKGLIKVRRG